MFKQTCTELLKTSDAKVKEWLNSFDTVLTDCDGVLWALNQAIHGSPDVINRLQDVGKRVYFVTNNSTESRSGFLELAHTLGFRITKENVISSSYAVAKYLEKRKFNKKVYLIGSSGMAQELDNVGIKHTGVGPDIMTDSFRDFLKQLKFDPEVGAVVVAYDIHFSFPKMVKAANYLNDPNCLFIATNTDARFPSKYGILPANGSTVRAVETCAEREPIIMGKPNVSICESLLGENGIVPERTLMIGDRCNTDVLLGTNCGFQTMLVGTGVHQLHDVHKWQKSESSEEKKLIPDVYLPKLGDLLPYLE